MKLRINFKVAGIGLAVAVALSMAPGAEAGGRIPSTVPQFGLYLQESFDLNLEPDNFYANADSNDSNKIVRSHLHCFNLGYVDSQSSGLCS